MMKKVKISLIALSSLLFVACTGENGNETDTSNTEQLQSNTNIETEATIETLEYTEEQPKIFDNIEFEDYAGYLVACDKDTVTFNYVEFKFNDAEPSGFSIVETEKNDTFNLADDVEVWYLIGAGENYVRIPYEELESYNDYATIDHGKKYWIPLFNEKEEVYGIVEKYVS